MKRRSFLFAPFALAGAPARAQVRYPVVTADTAIAFPRDHGSHPAFRTEWWYFTAWTRDGDGRDARGMPR